VLIAKLGSGNCQDALPWSEMTQGFIASMGILGLPKRLCMFDRYVMTELRISK
jgi:hypothetical protein